MCVKLYAGTVLESAMNGTIVMSVSASDGDTPRTAEGFGDVRYSLSGESAVFFTIDPISGEIKVFLVKCT